MSAAIAMGFHAGPNPADDAVAALPKKRPARAHFAAMPYRDVPAFFARLTASDMSPSARAAFEFLILTAARTSEVLNAEWSEVDHV